MIQYPRVARQVSANPKRVDGTVWLFLAMYTADFRKLAMFCSEKLDYTVPESSRVSTEHSLPDSCLDRIRMDYLISLIFVAMVRYRRENLSSMKLYELHLKFFQLQPFIGNH